MTPPSAIRFNREIPTKLEDIINKALEKERNLRYQVRSHFGCALGPNRNGRNLSFLFADNSRVGGETPVSQD